MADLDLVAFRNFAIAILIGALVGIEREKRRDTEQTIGGLRTFILLAMLGAIGGWLSTLHDSLVPLFIVLGLTTATVVAGFLMDAGSREGQLGLTTELAAVAVTLLGGFATLGHPELSVGLGIVTAAVLAYKQPLHGLIDKLGWDDIFAGLRLLIASFIVLPLLPNETLDPWGALNPRQLWLFVVLISALSMVGYVATRWLGPGRGALITGITGGMVSSTATTLAFSRQSRDLGSSASAQPFVSGTLLAWGIMFVRVLVVSFAVTPALVWHLAPPMIGMTVATLAIVVFLHLRHRSKTGGTGGGANLTISTPFSLTQAVKFGLLYAVILLVVKIVSEFGEGRGLYLVAAIAGSTDVDAITLSMSEYARSGSLVVASTAIVIAAITNTIVKGGIAIAIGGADYRNKLLIAMALISAVGILLTILGMAADWPTGQVPDQALPPG
ncbi:MAG TPA: MgtC/SapB family protein [Dongiaceae bacterium]|nr:MgtC/SapB family protein [Dongiaceae bacterium]